jgi:hypothetical protein
MCQPKIPSATAVAGAQTNSNIGTGIASQFLNNTNQTSPWGSVNNSVSGYNTVKGPNGEEYQIPQFQQTTTLSPGQQNLFNTQQSTQQSLADIANKQTDRLGYRLDQAITKPQYQQFSSGPKLQTQIADAGAIQRDLGVNDYGANVTQVQDALQQRYAPQLEADRNRLATQLSNQGIKLGSDAYSKAQQIQGVNENDARLGIILSAGQEQNRLQSLALNAGNFANSAQAQQYGQNAGNATFANGANQQMFQNNMAVTQANNGLQDSYLANDLARRDQLINEQSALMSGGQVSMPQFGGAAQTAIGGTDIAGAMQNQYAQQMAQSNNLWGGIGQIGAAAAPWLLSDERTKENKTKIGTIGKGIGVYEYNYKGDPTPQVGVMAQEAKRKAPEADAVRMADDGYYRVNYPKLVMATMGAR